MGSSGVITIIQTWTEVVEFGSLFCDQAWSWLPRRLGAIYGFVHKPDRISVGFFFPLSFGFIGIRNSHRTYTDIYS